MPLFSRIKFPGVDGRTNSPPLSTIRRPVTQPVSNGSGTNVNNDNNVSSFATDLRQETAIKDEESSFLYVTALRTKSRLSLSFEDLLRDRSTQGFFLQYLESRDAASFFKFWLDAESFYASAQSRLQTCDAGAATRPVQPIAVPDTSDRVGFCDAAGDTSDVSSPSRPVRRCSNKSGEFGDGPTSSNENRATVVGCGVDGQVTNGDFCSDLVGKTVVCCDREIDSDASSVKSEGSSKNPSINSVKRLSTHSRSPSVDANTILQKLRKSIGDDAVKIFTKYIAKETTHPIDVSDELRAEITAKICLEDGEIDISCFTAAQKHVCDGMLRGYFSDYLQSDYYCKYQIDVLTSGKVNLEDILYNDTALLFFTEFLEQEGRRGLLEFWLIADNFRRHLSAQSGKYDSSQAQDDAMVLYDKYFSLQATCPLGFDDSVRFEVEQNICREEGPLPDCFEKPIKMVFYHMQKNYLKAFLSSQLYFTYLSDLLNSARSRVEMGFKKRAGSDTSSEHSITTQNTLLVMDARQPGPSSSSQKLQKNVGHQDLRIDSSVFNPDALWKRNMAGKLSFGHVNRLGQFIPEFEPEPDKKTFAETVLSKAMRRFVNREEGKAKEEMAWQVAEMIVREVTSVTSQQNDPKEFSPIT